MEKFDLALSSFPCDEYEAHIWETHPDTASWDTLYADHGPYPASSVTACSGEIQLWANAEHLFHSPPAASCEGSMRCCRHRRDSSVTPSSPLVCCAWSASGTSSCVSREESSDSGCNQMVAAAAGKTVSALHGSKAVASSKSSKCLQLQSVPRCSHQQCQAHFTRLM